MHKVKIFTYPDEVGVKYVPCYLLGLVNPDKSSPNIQYVTDMRDADYCALPFRWKVRGEGLDRAVEIAQEAQKYELDVLIWHDGDLPPRIPFDNYVLFAPGLYASKRRAKEFGALIFISDPYDYFGSDSINTIPKPEIPSIGFTGNSNIGLFKLVYAFSTLNARALAARLGFTPYRSYPTNPPQLLRSHMLNVFDKNPKVNTSFVRRDRHLRTVLSVRDRINKEKQTSDTSKVDVYFRNMMENAYTLCVRGFGNWSFRFYETLACGRIPIFIDTDCLLPFEEVIDWRKHCVWIESHERKHAVEKVLEFHNSLSPQQFIDLQQSNRDLWVNYLRYETFSDHICQVLSS